MTDKDQSTLVFEQIKKLNHGTLAAIALEVRGAMLCNAPVDELAEKLNNWFDAELKRVAAIERTRLAGIEKD